MIKRLKKIIFKPLEIPLNSFFNFLEKIIYNSNSEIANDITFLKNRSQSDKGELDLNIYLYELDNYYKYEIKKKYNGKKLMIELQTRKSEIQNRMTFVSNVYLALGTGIIAGLIANNIRKIDIFFNFNSTSLFGMLLNLLVTVTYSTILFLVPFIIILIYKKTSSIRDPLENALEDFELVKINELIDFEFKSYYIKEN